MCGEMDWTMQVTGRMDSMQLPRTFEHLIQNNERLLNKNAQLYGTPPQNSL
jgi:hypothetical protein